MSESTSRNTSAAVQALIDKQEIREVILRYCRAVDRIDVDLMRSCFHPDAWVDFGITIGPVDKLYATLERETAKMLGTQHLIGQTLIDLEGAKARSETYITAHHRLSSREEGKKIDLVVGTRYLDIFERREDGPWLIAQRNAVVDWSRFDEVRGELPGLETYITGQRGDRSDLVYNLGATPRRGATP
jgi:hypothetical protein